MGEENHDDDVDTGIDDNDAGANDVDETADDADTANNTDANDDSDGSGSEDGNKDGKGDSKEGSDNADDDTEEEEDDGSEPELRKPKQGASNAEWAAWRAQEKAKSKDGTDNGDNSDNDDVDEDDDDDLSDEDKAAFDKRISKRLAPIEKQAAENEVKVSIAEFVKDNPDFAPFAKKAERFALHKSRANIPIKSIFFEVAGDKLMQIGAKRGRVADKKAKETQAGGGNSGGEEAGNKNYKDMPLGDFEKELESVKMGKR